MKTVVVSALEFEALKQVDRMVRIAMAKPDAADGLVAAIQALDAVRREEAGDLAAPQVLTSSDLASAAIERAKFGGKT